MLTKKNGAKLGVDGGVCTVVRVTDAAGYSGTLQCLVSYSLPGGLVTAQELVSVTHAQFSGSHTAAITGGTNRFRNARGQATVTFLSNSAATVRLSISQ